MSETIESEPRRHAEVERDASASDIRKKTWPHGMPALRLSRTPHRSRPVSAPVSGGQGGLHAHRGLLRMLRLVTGLALLVIAWACVLADVALIRVAVRAAAPARGLGHYLGAVLGVAAACWIGLMALVCIVAGAFFLTIALTRHS